MFASLNQAVSRRGIRTPVHLLKIVFVLVDLREIKVASTEEALKLLQLGLRHRHIAGTRLNYQSSRSHAIFTIKIIRINISSRRRQRVTGVNRYKKEERGGEKQRETCMYM